MNTYLSLAAAMPLPRSNPLAAIARFVRALRRRRRFAQLRLLEDSRLADIGVTRDDIAWGLALPLHEDAADRVQRRVRRRETGLPTADAWHPARAAVNRVSPWTGRAVSRDGLTSYRGHTVGFASREERYEFERAIAAFDAAIARADAAPRL